MTKIKTDDMIRQCLRPDGLLSAGIPNYEFRPQQLQMALDIAATLHSVDGVFMAEAGTGTGKSLAYLIPAALLLRNVVISTGTKNLQEQLIEKDIPLLNKLLDQPVLAVLVKGRQNYLCKRRMKSFRERPEFNSVAEKKLFKLICVWENNTVVGDRAEMEFLPDYTSLWQNICSRRDDCMGGRCPEYGSCFLLRLRIRAQAADLVVVNHHLFFADAAMRRKNSISALPDTKAVIFDEAHLLDEIVTQFLGVHLGQTEINDFLRLIRRWKPSRKDLGKGKWSLTGVLGSVEEGAVMFFGSLQAGDGRFELLSRLNEETCRMGVLFIERLEYLNQNLDREGLIPQEFIDEWKQLCEEIIGKVRFFMSHDEPDMAWWGEHSPKGNSLHASPIDISEDFPRIIQNPLRPVIMTSATLTTGDSFNFIINRLGIHHCETTIYPSPFDYATQGLIYIPENIPEPNHPDFFQAGASEILQIIEASKGRAFILTTSYSAMNKFRDLIEDELEYNLLVQGDAPKQRLIRDFIKDKNSVLLATISFWQGVDVPGEALSAVIIDRLPFASPSDPVVRAKIDHLNDRNGNAFMKYQVPSAIMMLKQGVGRLIRSRADRGLVVVLDNRILKKRYGSEFIRSLPGFTRARSIDVIERFFNETSDLI
ncbi:ATP-dependent DNA helicase [bacterium]|nr:ATP-dependent DNA helicase [bacterium]